MDRRAHARHARAVLDEPAAAPPVVGHDDWRVEHVRFDGDRIVAVYDWASLKAVPETSLVGSASHAYGADWTTPNTRVPDRDDALAFVADYELARGRPFTQAERRRIDAYWLYTVSVRRPLRALTARHGGRPGPPRLPRPACRPRRFRAGVTSCRSIRTRP